MLTDGNADDAKTGLELISAVEDDVESFTADAAYDTLAIYRAAKAKGAKVIVPPVRGAAVSKRAPRSAARDRTIRKVKEVGRREWKKESGYHRQGAALERLLQVQVDHRRSTSCATSGSTGSRSVARLQHPEPDVRAWPTGVGRDRGLRWCGTGTGRLTPIHAPTPPETAGVGKLPTYPDSRNNATKSRRCRHAGRSSPCAAHA